MACKDPKKLYLIYVWHDIEVSLQGPFATEEERDAAALELYKEDGDRSGIFRLNTSDQNPQVL